MNYSFNSVLAPDIESFIKMKRSLGYKYHNEEYILHRFDTYWKNENDPSDSVTMESLSGWVKQLPTEGKSSQYARIHTVKQFLLFRTSLGKPSYIPLDKIKCPRHPVIHILSKNEIQSLFAEIDSYRPARPSPETMSSTIRCPSLCGLRPCCPADIIPQTSRTLQETGSLPPTKCFSTGIQSWPW